MKLKDKILEFGNCYSNILKETNELFTKIKPKLKDIKGVVRFDKLIERKDFYPKHDVITLLQLAEEYNEDSTNLKKLFKKYFEIENVLNKNKNIFEDNDLKISSIGPKSIQGMINEEVYFSINIETSSIIRVYLDVLSEEEYEENGYPEGLKAFMNESHRKIEQILEEEIKI